MDQRLSAFRFLFFIGLANGVRRTGKQRPTALFGSQAQIRASAFALRASADGSRGWNLQNSGADALRER
jgi:hypothetical protein